MACKKIIITHNQFNVLIGRQANFYDKLPQIPFTFETIPK